MIKYSFIVIGVYILYYAGNIAYDLFFKKNRTLETDVVEEYSLVDLGQGENSPTQIGIEDVEHINTPNSFLKNRFQSESNDSDQITPTMEDLRMRFEAEQDIDGDEGEIQQTITSDINGEEASASIENQAIEGDNKTSNWQSLLKLSETTVQLVANYDGQKVYHSIT